MGQGPLDIKRIEAYAVSAAAPDGLTSSLAEMPVRNGLLLRVVDGQGAWGWGESWCNFPPRGNIAKMMLLEDLVGPAALQTSETDFRMVRPALEHQLARMEIHIGETGPISHLLAGIDMALADLAARRKNVPLANLLSGSFSRQVCCYASSPPSNRFDDLLPRLSADGHTAVKIKIGYDWERDQQALERFRSHLPDATLYVDANQSWTADVAERRINELTRWSAEFVEEPLRADCPLSDWSRLAANVPISLAAGENILSAQRFAEMVSGKALAVIQPDVAKWGGVSGAVEVGRHALASCARFYLHYMGTAIGLATSLHVLASTESDGRVELDANPNPLRTDLGEIDLTVKEGRMNLPSGAGIGFDPDPAQLKSMTVASCVVEAR